MASLRRVDDYSGDNYGLPEYDVYTNPNPGLPTSGGDTGGNPEATGIDAGTDRAGQTPPPEGPLAPAPQQAAPDFSKGYYRPDGGWQQGGPAPAAAKPAPAAPPPQNYGFNPTPIDMSGYNKMQENLSKVFNNGGNFNQDIVNRRVDNVRGVAEKSLKSRNATNDAALAARGLIGDGPQMTAMNRANEATYNDLLSSTNDIYANESQNADQRMMQALQLATGLTDQQARAAIDNFRAQSDSSLGFGNLDLGNRRLNLDRELGQGNLALGNRNAGITSMLGTGNLALGNLRAANDYNLGQANYGLDRDKFLASQENGGLDQILQIMDLIMRGSGQSAQGHY